MPSMKIIIFLLMTISLTAMVFCSKNDCGNWELESNVAEVGKGKRELRESTSGLFPFPRVGRAGKKSWKSRFLDQIKRREGLIPFPRIGRSGGQTTPNNDAFVQIPRHFPFASPLMRTNNGGGISSAYYKKNWFLAPYREYNQPLLISDSNETVEYGDETQKNDLPSYLTDDDAGNKEAAMHSTAD